MNFAAALLVDTRTCAQLAALFDTIPLADGDRLPPCWHWAIAATPAVDTKDLGSDGHPASTLPDPSVRGWRRMWGGSKLVWHSDLLVGQRYFYERATTSFEEKNGRSGRIAVCTVAHKWFSDRGDLALDEEQSIVYLPADSIPTAAQQDTTAIAPGDGDGRLTPVHLFRYSAVTFNSHRIHYDQRYASEVEGYPTLVVHGPLLATLLAGWIEKQRKAQLTTFDFRNLKPVFLGQDFGYRDNGDNCEIHNGFATCLTAKITIKEQGLG